MNLTLKIMSKKLLSKDQQKLQSKVKIDTPIGEIEIDKEKLEKNIGKFKIITLIILITILAIILLKGSTVISYTFQASNIA